MKKSVKGTSKDGIVLDLRWVNRYSRLPLWSLWEAVKIIGDE